MSDHTIAHPSCSRISYAPSVSRYPAGAMTPLNALEPNPADIGATKFAIWTAVAKYQPVSISRIGEILILDLTTLTRSLQLLKRQGLLEISPRSVRRQRFLNLTDKAVKVLEIAVPLW